MISKLVRLTALGAIGLALIPSAPARAQNPNPIVPMLLCPFGCGNTEGYAVLGNLMARAGSSVTLAPQETPGYMYNVRAMAEQRRWKTTVFGTEDTIVLLAPHGGKEEIKEFLPEPVTVPFRTLVRRGLLGTGQVLRLPRPQPEDAGRSEGQAHCARAAHAKRFRVLRTFDPGIRLRRDAEECRHPPRHA